MVDGAEVVRDPVLAAMADEQDVHVPQLAAAVRAGPRSLGRRRLVKLARLPVRALDRPRDYVLEAAERGAAVTRRFVEPESIVRLNARTAPRASLAGHFPLSNTLARR